MTKPAAELAAELDGYEVDVIDEAEGKRLVDEKARKVLGISGEEFVRRWEAGEIPDPDRTEVIAIYMMLPFMKQSPNGSNDAV
jgi:hypothetical protein